MSGVKLTFCNSLPPFERITECISTKKVLHADTLANSCAPSAVSKSALGGETPYEETHDESELTVASKTSHGNAARRRGGTCTRGGEGTYGESVDDKGAAGAREADKPTTVRREFANDYIGHSTVAHREPRHDVGVHDPGEQEDVARMSRGASSRDSTTGWHTDSVAAACHDDANPIPSLLDVGRCSSPSTPAWRE